MSGVGKAIGKAFKSVVRVVKKIAPYALAIGAVVLTGGAALGALPAVATMVGSLGLGTTLTGVITGAVTSAGWGALMGAGTAAISGKNIGKGLLSGALTGAVTGGVLGGLSPTSFGVQAAAKGATTAANAGSTVGSATVSGASGAGGAAASAPLATTASGATGVSAATGGMLPVSSVAPLNVAPGLAPAAAGATAPAATGGLLGGDMMKTMMIGNAISGVGQGLMAPDPNAPWKQAAKNYRTSGAGLLSEDSMAYLQGGDPNPTPSQRYDPIQYGTRIAYDPNTKQVRRVPA